MKSLKDYISEELFATPGDTIGMGNPMMPSMSENPGELSTQVGSGDVISAPKTKKKKFKRG